MCRCLTSTPRRWSYQPVVEDQEDLRGILRDLLTGSGYEVAEAADGRDGVAKALSERPDLILMDIQLPILDG